MPRALALLLCAYLLVWVPANFAGELFSSMSSIGRRGPLAVGELTFHGAVAALCATAGWTVRVRAPAAMPAAALAVIVSSIATTQSLYWTVLPRQTAPGERAPLAALVAAHAVFWLVVMRRYRDRNV